jgi:hypothetical protein
LAPGWRAPGVSCWPMPISLARCRFIADAC